MSQYIYVYDRHNPRLGRIVRHDSRSLAYEYTPKATAVVDTRHDRHVPIFYQGQLGSCTGNAGLGVLGHGAFYTTVQSLVAFDEPTAVAVYSEATKIDNVNGVYPPTDTGSSGIGVGAALKNRRLISGYQNITKSFDNALLAVVDQPVITGVPWYTGMDNPDSNGFISISGKVDGGHEFVVYGIDTANKAVLCANSWGTNWGLSGYFKMTYDTWRQLLAKDGDVTVFVPLTQPAPTPTPVPVPTPTPTPTPTPVSEPDWAGLNAWLKRTGRISS